MIPFNWARWIRSLTARPVRKARRSARPALEPLECRITPAVRTWDGDDTANMGLWSAAGNWRENAAPTNGDVLIFPASIPLLGTRVTTNDPTDLRVASISFDGDGTTSTSYTLNGNPIIFGRASSTDPAPANTITANTNALKETVNLDLRLRGTLDS